MSGQLEPKIKKAALLTLLRQYDEAEAILTEILQLDPLNKATINGLKILFSEKIKSPKPAKPLPDKTFMPAHIAFENGHYNQSIEICNSLIKIYPNSKLLVNLAGVASTRLGLLDQAIVYYNRAIQIDPSFAVAHNNKGASLKDKEDLEPALHSYKEAIRLEPEYAEAHSNMGAVLGSLGEHQEALKSFSKALKLKPKFPDALNNKGIVLAAIGDNEAAIEAFSTAIQLHPNYAEAHLHKANSYTHLGDNKMALEFYTKAARLNPRLSPAHLGICQSKKIEVDDPQINIMTALLDDLVLPNKDKANLNFALANVHEGLHNYALAFEFYAAGNRLKKKESQYTIVTDQTLFSAIKPIFKKGPPKLSYGRDLEQKAKSVPIFILGMPRSGSSLVEQIISSHSKVFGAGELESLAKSIKNINWDTQSLSKQQLHSCRNDYLEALGQLSEKEFITDKMPVNFRWIGFILAAIPEAKIINIQRDKLATCWSIYKHNFSSTGNGYANDLNDISAYYDLYTDLMEFWRSLYPNSIYDLDYEKLTENQTEETQKVLNYIGVEWEDACVDFHQNKRAVSTSSARQVRKKMYQNSSQQWRKFENQILPILGLVSKEVTQLPVMKNMDPPQELILPIVKMFESEDNEGALKALNHLLERYPQSSVLLNNKGLVLAKKLRRYDEALDCLNKALEINPLLADAHNSLAVMYKEIGDIALAEQSVRTALSIKEDYPEAHNLLGIVLKAKGDSNGAAESYKRAIEIAPEFAIGHRHLSSVKKYSSFDNQCEQMQRLLDNPSAPECDKIDLNFALGKAYEDIKDYNRAFDHFVEGNRLRKSELNYDLQSDKKLFSGVLQTFMGNVPSLLPGEDFENEISQTPIFILGMPRSGSTLAEQILSSHSKVFGAGELNTLNDCIKTLDWQGITLSKKQLQQVRSYYLENTAGISNLPYVTDKMPLNFRWTGLILSAIPEAKIIYTVRDARATCWSIFKTYFASNGNGFSHDLADLEHYQKMQVDLMGFFKAKYPGRIFELNYETLTENQEQETRKLLDYVGLDWEQRCMDFHKNKRAVLTASNNQVTQKLYKNSSEAWRNYEKNLTDFF
ncbi:sulfotransferase [SAR92 clade bacterium H455]|uniref:Sulfotransferase n=1 Tax=SAR92 clade bacterium H455 TaxID=2974818 RepID=A0ABY5TR58_9GAMM|nr:sulfotransferase [SAR92 clade bacterium H455]